MPVLCTCETCSATFTRPPSIVAKGKGRFCSRSCAPQFQRARANRVCEVCGTVFEIKLGKLTDKTGRFCSARCRDKGIKTIEIRTCEVCGKRFEFQVSRGGKGRFCSYACSNKGRSGPGKGLSGPNSPHWRGGKSFEPYPIIWNEQLKTMIRERDRYHCGLCGRPGSMHVHHIDYDKAHCTPDNLITLCPNCHPRTNYRRAFWQALCTEIMTLRTFSRAA